MKIYVVECSHTDLTKTPIQRISRYEYYADQMKASARKIQLDKMVEELWSTDIKVSTRIVDVIE